MSKERTIRCGTCGSDDLTVSSTFDTEQYPGDFMQYTRFTGTGSMFIKCNICGRMITVVFSKYPSKKYPKQHGANGALNRMLTAFEGRSRFSRWAKCITDYKIPPRIWR